MNMSERSRSKKQTRSFTRRILSDEEVQFLTRRLAKAINSISGTFSFQDRLDLQDSIRFQAVATRLRECRESRGMDLKSAAKAMRVAWYRLRDIEECRVKNLDGSVLYRYVDFLGLQRWFAAWSKATPKLVADLLVKRDGRVQPQGPKKPSRTRIKPHGTF